MTGTVTEVGGGVYRVRLDGGRELEASLRGRLKREVRVGDRVVVGDRVEVREDDDGSVTVERVHARRTQIVRRTGPGRKPKTVAANVDRLVVVLAAGEPEPSRELVDRLLVLAEGDRLEAAVVMNKMDLPGAVGAAAPFLEIYPPLGYPVLAVSAREGRGLEAVRSLMGHGTSVLVGPSGTGKSTLLNSLQPGLELRTADLSRKARRGRHTTVSARLLPLSFGGAVADTPGFAEVGLWGVEPRELDERFPEMRERSGECRFRGCAHMAEPDCAVRQAVEEGRIAPSRYASYRAFHAEVSEVRR